MTNIIFVLDNVRSSFNVGAVFRTADGLGASINLIGITPIPHSDKKLDKTSLSSLDYVDWKYFDNSESWFKYILLTRSKEKPNLIISIEEGKDLKTVSLFDLKNKIDKEYENIYLVFGHEINGVSEFIQNKSDFILKIPMSGKKNSLNVSTCAGIVGYRMKELILSI